MAELEIKPTSGMRVRVVLVMLCAASIAFVLVWLLTGGGLGLFARKTDISTFMPDATGLEIGSPVRLNGIQIGTVKNVAISGFLDIQRAVFLDLRVETKYLSRIPADSITSIGADTLIGNKFVDIDPGKDALSLREGGELRSEPAASAADKADLILNIQESMRKIDNMVAQISSPDTQIGRYIVGEKEYGQVLRQITTFEKGMREAVSPDNAGVGQALFTMNLYNQIRSPLLQIDATLQAIQKGEGAAGRIYSSDEQYNAILKQLKDLRQTIAQARTDMASFGPGLRDEDSYQKIVSMLASTDALLASLTSGEGRAGDLLNNPQLYETLVGSLRGMEEMLRDVQSNPKKYLRLKVF